MSAPRTPLIELAGVCRSYRSGDVVTHALRGVDLSIDAGEFVAIIGASGSGKSTLMNILGLIDRPSRGAYRFGGRDVAGLNRDELAALRRGCFGFIFQHYHLLPTVSALGNVEMPAVHAGAPRGYRHARAAALLARLGLANRITNRPSQLSGGQQQRVSIARALMNGGGVILADEPTGALDSKSGAEVLAILKELAGAGHTIILITHDARVAAAAERIIRIEDGLIVSDSGRAARVSSSIAVAAWQANGASPPLWTWLEEAARSAFAALAVNPVRTALTLSGIVIGVASVVAMMAIGRGAQASFMERASAIGTNWVVVSRAGESAATSMPMTSADAEAIKDLANVSGSMPAVWEAGTLRHGNTDINAEVIATTAEFRAVHNWDAAKGAFFTKEDEISGNAVMLLGATLAAKLFPDIADPSGNHILVNNIPFLVTGVLASKGLSERGTDRDNNAVLPLRTGAMRLYGKDDVTEIVVSIADMSRLQQTKDAIKALLIRRHGREDFWLHDAASAFRKAEEERRSTNLLLGAIAAISMLVGGIGIMNIMLITVAERTREIGIRTAIGARTADIMGQFLTEAIVLSAIGGVVGLLFGGLIGTGAALMFGMTVIFSPTVAVSALTGAVAMGMLFGFMPAFRAARLKPVEALARG
ncbi:ABC transporter permease [Nitrobacter sp.]|uniref:ABC transporter permease n=1 Tax=Nitrobacter sp. TaxID=29420 RepID=UPI0029CAC754|nr:ABC transporter permease [Nitrobacter sp.]